MNALDERAGLPPGSQAHRLNEAYASGDRLAWIYTHAEPARRLFTERGYSAAPAASPQLWLASVHSHTQDLADFMFDPARDHLSRQDLAHRAYFPAAEGWQAAPTPVEDDLEVPVEAWFSHPDRGVGLALVLAVDVLSPERAAELGLDEVVAAPARTLGSASRVVFNAADAVEMAHLLGWYLATHPFSQGWPCTVIREALNRPRLLDARARFLLDVGQAPVRAWLEPC